MTKADKIVIVLIMICSLLLFIPILNNQEEASIAIVEVSNKEVLRIDLSQDDEYEVSGTLGTIHIQVKDKKVRVTQENSPHHTCSKQGYVSDTNTPIVCLPNETIITIEGSESEEDTVIQ